MLVLTRKSNQSLMIGENVEVVVLQIKGNNVKLGIKAPRNHPIYRREIYDQIKQQNEMAAMTSLESLGAIKGILPPVQTSPPRNKIKLR